MSAFPGAPEDWDLSRPPSRIELLGFAAERWFRRTFVLIFFAALAFAVVVGVPAFAVVRSPAYVAARQFVLDSSEVASEVGDVVSFDRVPTRYHLESDKASFVFDVQGSISHGIASVSVQRGDGIWNVTSAAFVTDPRLRGVHRRIVLVRGDAAPVGSR